MRLPKISDCTFLAVVLILSCAATPRLCAQEQQGFRPLFNGKDLSGWVVMHGPGSAWTVDEGVLSSNAPPKCWLRATDEFVNYVLRLEWRLTDAESNSGVFLNARDVGEEFPSSLEIQIYKKNAAAMFPIRRAVGGPTAFTWEDHVRPPGEWNRYEIAVNNGSILLSVNGHLVNQATLLDPAAGYIGLQSETGRVEFRNIEIRELPSPISDVRWSGGRKPGSAPSKH